MNITAFAREWPSTRRSLLGAASRAVIGVIVIAAAVHAQSPASRDTAAASTTDAAHHHRWLSGDFGFALGPGIGWQRYADQVSGRETALTAVGGFFRGAKLGPESKGGFVPTFAVTLFPTKIAAVSADPAARQLATIRLRPIMLGLGWFHPIGRTLSVRLNGLGGWSFNGLGGPDAASQRPQLQLASTPTAVGGNFTWATSGKLWFNTSPGVSFITGVSFIHARPELTLADGSVRGWNADHVRLDAGVAFTLVHWHRD